MASVDPSNLASLAIIRKLKMEYVRFENDEHGMPTLVYRIVNAENRKRNLETMRENAIKHIYSAFEITLHKAKPTQLSRKATISYGPELAKEEFGEMLGGKRWNEVINADHLPYSFTDIDSLDVLSDEALAYYAPAFFIRVTQQPGWWSFYTEFLFRLTNVAERFSNQQLEVLIEVLHFHAELRRFYAESRRGKRSDSFVEELDEAQLRLMLHLDERKQKKVKS